MSPPLPTHTMAIALTCVAGLGLLGWIEPAAAQDGIVLTVRERAGVARASEPVASGVPLPRAWNVTDPATLRLTDAGGTPIPAQFEPLARWGGPAHATTAPIRWVLVQFRATVPADGVATYTLDRNGPGPAPTEQISWQLSPADDLVIDTGAAVFQIDTDAFNLFEQVRIGGQDLLEPLPPRDALAYRAPAAWPEIATSGSLPDLTPRPTSVTVERDGPLALVVRARGSLLNEHGEAILDYTARLHFTAGSTDVRVDFTVENNHPIVEDLEGQPINVCDQRSTYSVYIGSLALHVRLADAGTIPHAVTQDGIDVAAGGDDPTSPLVVYQDSSGTEFWDAYVGDNVGWSGGTAHPRLQSYCSLPGFQILRDPDVLTTGSHSEGWIGAYFEGTTGPGLCAVVRDFWQNFPKRLEAERGTVAVDLFPNGEQFVHNFRVGEQKTHTMLFSFSRGPIEPVEASRRARAFQAPLFAAAPLAWYVDSGALGEVTAEDIAAWPLYERFCRTAFEPNPDFDPTIHDPNLGNRTLLEIIEQYNFYGWQDYGDFPLDYEAFGDNQAGQMNLKYWYLYGLLVHYCRSADPRWLDLALPAAWHLADIDFCHIPDEGVSHWAHGAYFGHAAHDEPGNWNPNRNYGRPMLNLFYGVPDLILAYHLTGEQRFLDVALEGLQGIANLLPFSDYPGGDIGEGLGRDTINFLFAYLEGYRQTGDPQLLDRIRYVLGHTTDFSSKGWVTDPRGYVPPTPEQAYIRTFMFVQTLWGLGRYLDFLGEWGLPDDLGVADALQAYADFVINFVMVEDEPGTAALWYDYWFDGEQTSPSLGRDYNYLDHNNWALVTADALAYTYKYTGQSRYLDQAAKFYLTGTVDPAWKGDPPVYVSTKDLVNSLNWGLVYMNQRGPQRPSACRRWRMY